MSVSLFETPVSSFQSDLSCKNTKQKLGVMFTNTNYVTLKYVTDGWGTDSNGFKLVITAVKDISKEILPPDCTQEAHRFAFLF